MKLKTMGKRPHILKDHLKRVILKTISQHPHIKVLLCLTSKKYQPTGKPHLAYLPSTLQGTLSICSETYPFQVSAPFLYPLKILENR